MSDCAYDQCDGSGFLFDEEKRTSRPCPCRPARIARRRAAALEARLPKRYRDVAFDREPMLSIERENAVVVGEVRRYIRSIGAQLDEGRGMWFTGTPGTGKTTLAMLISRAAIEADRTVAIYSLPRLLSMLRDTFDESSRYSLGDLIERLSTVDLLHVDDVGAEQSSPWVLEQLYTIVNSRYEEGRAIVLTTNLADAGGDAALREQIGERTVSRIYEICGDPKPMFGHDRRMDSTYTLPAATSERRPDGGAERPAAPVGGRPAGALEWDDGLQPYGELPRQGRLAS
jgi:DNA replication protein DnaC